MNHALCKLGSVILFAAIVMTLLIPGFVYSEAGDIIEGYFTGNKIIRPIMIRAGESMGILQAYEPVRLTIIDREWGSVKTEDGKTGYIFYDGILPLPEYKSTEEKMMYSETDINLFGVPLDEAPAIGVLKSMTLCIKDGVSENLAHIYLPESGIKGYVSADALKEAVFSLQEKPETVTVIAITPVELTALPLYGSAVVGQMEAGKFAIAYEAGFPDHLVMREGNTVCYLPKASVCVCFANSGSKVEIEDAVKNAVMPEEADLSGATVVRNEYLDQALAMLDENNSFLIRYNEVTGAEIRALFSQGVPYFWGGRSYNVLRELYPEYYPLAAWQSSPLYYRQGNVYLYGFDCIGFVKAVCTLAKKPVKQNLYELFGWEYCHDGYHVWCKTDHPIPEDWKSVSESMRPGDILVVYHPGEHAMMYLGTLREFGYTEEQLPQMADYLDYPLMIQSGEDPMCYLRFSEYIRVSQDERIQRATPPDGGVSVCILGVPEDKAEYMIRTPHMDYYTFFAEGTCVNLFDFERVNDYIVYRQQ